MTATLLIDQLPPVLSSGSIVLDTASRVLTGPAGSMALDVAPFLVLRELLRRPGAVVSLRQLIEAAWPDPDLEPSNPERAIRKRVDRTREVLEQVGVSRGRLALRFMAGYVIERERLIVRVLTAEQAALVDRVLGAHLPAQNGPARAVPVIEDQMTRCRNTLESLGFASTISASGPDADPGRPL